MGAGRQRMVIITKADRPKHCKSCRRQDTFDPDPQRDIKTVSDKVVFTAWKCRNCGRDVIWPVDQSKKEG